MNLTVRKLTEDEVVPIGKVQELPKMTEITDLEVQNEVFSKLYSDSTKMS